MGRSSWDILCFNKEGNPSNGNFLIEENYFIEIYKNYLNIRKSENEILFSLEYGKACFLKTEIHVQKGSQESIFVFVYDFNSKNWMAGIGAYGFDDPKDRICEFFKIDQSLYDHIFVGSSYYDCQHYHFAHCIKDNKSEEFETLKNEENEYLESKYVGIKKETYDEFIIWLGKIINEQFNDEVKKWFQKIKTKKPLRCNQGEAFYVDFEKSLTEIGKQNNPSC